jgi:ParB family chromosome partitioning protein
MKLQFIALDKLHVSPLNMRHGKKPPDVSDILPSVRARGVIMPVAVRPEGDPGCFGVVAGARRLHAALLAAQEGDLAELPCAVLEDGDDADAIEASLIENVARRDPDEVSQWETFVKLVKQGRDPADLGATFGLPETGVRRILALGNLLPRIRGLYAQEKIDAATIRHLTMASKKQQSAWLALFDDPNAYVPTGHQVKAWLFGGQSIKTAHALFDLADYKGAIVSDLFGEDRYFADTDSFWALQNAAIEGVRQSCLAEGWSDVVVLAPDQRFHTWEHEKTGRAKGGRIYIEVRSSGEVTQHIGYLTRKEARARERGESSEATAKPVRPEVTSSLNTYIDLHRHAAVRAALTGCPGMALRLMVAHAIAGSPLWRVEPEPQTSRNEAVAASVAASKGEAQFAERRRAVLALLGFDPERETLVRRYGDSDRLVPLFLRLLDLPDAAVLDVVSVVMGESLAAGSDAVEAIGHEIGIDMADWWQADDALFELLRDKAVIGAITAEVAGDAVAQANADEKTKTLKAIVRASLDGRDGRVRHERWVPRWMAFPPAGYTPRGGVGSVAAHARLRAACDERLTEPVPLAA